MIQSDESICFVEDVQDESSFLNAFDSQPASNPYIEDPLKHTEIITTRFKCLACNKSFPSLFSLRWHENRRSVRITANCQLCTSSTGKQRSILVYNQCALSLHRIQHGSLDLTNPSSCTFERIEIEPVTIEEFDEWLDMLKLLLPESERRSQSIATLTMTSSSSSSINSIDFGKNYNCVECKTRFTNSNALRQHFLASIQRRLICAHCPAVFFSRCALSAHMRCAHTNSSNRLVCPECGQLQDSRESWQAHLYSHKFDLLSIDSWHCDKCLNFYGSLEAIVLHVANDHLTESNVSPNSFKCDYCYNDITGDRNAVFEHARFHMANVKPKKVFRCSICGRLIDGKPAVKGHMRMKHNLRLRIDRFIDLWIDDATVDQTSTTFINAKVQHSPSKSSCLT